MNENKIRIPKYYSKTILSICDSGKTNFCLRYVDDRHDENTIRAFGIDSFVKDVILNNREKIKIKLFDTASGERSKYLLYTNIWISNRIIFLYDITYKYSFYSAKSRILDEKEKYNDKVKAIVGNKIDRKEDRQVTTE